MNKKTPIDWLDDEYINSGQFIDENFMDWAVEWNL